LFAKQKDTGEQSLAKIAVQFHQQNLSQICVLKFAKCCSLFALFVRQKKLLFLFANMLRNRPPGEPVVKK